MHKSLIILSLVTAALAGCVQNDGTRALIGAGVGAAAASVTENDVALGAVGGAAAGALCDDAGICR
jgi:osmotically inducible lipoprotein OsmB